MKSFDENELIAYHLHELAPRRELEIRQILDADAVATAESDAIAETLRAFRGYGAAPVVDAAVMERTWQSIRPSLVYLAPRPQRVNWLRSLRWKPLGIGLGLAGVTAGVVMVLLPHRVSVPVATEGTVGSTAAVAPLVASAGAPVGTDLLERQVMPERYNGRPGPLTTAPVGRDADDALLIPPGTRMESRIEPPAPAVVGVAPSSSSASTFSEAQTNPIPIPNATKLLQIRPSQIFRETDVALGGYGVATVASSQDTGSGSRTMTMRPSVGLRASFHQQFKRWLGYEIAAGGTHTTVRYAYSGPSPVTSYAGSISSNVFELTGTYVVQGPRGKQFSSFADAGGGMLVFVSSQATQSVSSNYRPAAVAGAGVEYHLGRHWGVRGEYRGMFLVGPTFNYEGMAIPVASHKMLSNEPTLSLTYRFGERDKN